MSVSKKQLEKIDAICKCGCGQSFNPFPVYRSKAEGGGLRIPEYIRGHGPTNRKTQFGDTPWNKGLTKDVCPTLSKMGFQPGHKPYNDWSHVNRRLKRDKEFRKRWLSAKQGKTAWNKGLRKDAYTNGIKSGSAHGNWKGNYGGVRDLSVYRELRLEIMKRDNYTCQHCGDRNREGRGSRIRLHVHHSLAIKDAPLLSLDPNNCITLCEPCHRKTENFGSKALKHRRKKSGK